MLTAAEEAQTRTLLAQQAQILTLAGSEPAIMSSLGATDVNLSQLPSAGSVADADILLLRQGSTDKSVAGSTLKSYAQPSAASDTVSGIVELATNAEVQTGADSVRAVTPAGRRSDTATSSSDPTYVDNSTKSASTQWVRNAMLSIATAAGFVLSAATNGYIKFPSWLGSLIIQWGTTGSISANGTLSVTMPIVYPTSNLCAVCMAQYSSGPNVGYMVSIYSRTVSSMSFYNSNASTALVASWISMGH